MQLDGLFTTDSEAATEKAITTNSFRADNKPYLIVSYGLGRDRTALLIKLATLGIRPDLILFCDLGAEKSASYAYLPLMNAFLKSVGFPPITVIRLNRKRDSDFEAHLFRLGIFASFNYGKSHACSATWKLDAQDDFLKTYEPVIKAKREARRIIRAVGFELGEERRIKDAKQSEETETADALNCGQRSSSAFAVRKDSEYLTWYSLIEWKMDFDAVLDTIWKSGLPICPKSSCYFCPAMRPEETADLAVQEPHLFFKGLVLERIAQRNKIVPHKHRVQGLRFGAKWSDYAFAAPYLARIDKIIDLFQLDRALEDGEKSTKSVGWKKKAARVELFRALFVNADNLSRFMNNEMDLTIYEKKVQEINLMDIGERQMALPID
jgi:hypothetical protein